MKQKELISTLTKYPGNKDIKFTVNGEEVKPKIKFEKNIIQFDVKTSKTLKQDKKTLNKKLNANDTEVK